MRFGAVRALTIMSLNTLRRSELSRFIASPAAREAFAKRGYHQATIDDILPVGAESGDADLDRFFHKFAGQNQFRHYVGVTYVAVADRRILGL